MAERFSRLEQAHIDFIGRQNIFFTATGTAGSRINISPRSTEAFRIVAPDLVGYLDMTGSGSETAAHLRADGRMTMMFCAVAGPPLILRIYGGGTNHFIGTEEYERLLRDHFDGRSWHVQRQIVMLHVDLVLTSCGYGVPLFEFVGERPSMANWANAKSPEEIRAYWAAHNRVSLDGLPTGMPTDGADDNG